MKTIALLPMKANSERVVGKNFRDLGGKPLYRWILDALLAVDSINAVVINTDARSELAGTGLVESERVIIRDRKPEICGDMVSMNKIIADDIAAVPADLYAMTHATNPLLSPATIGAAIETFRSSDADSLFTVTRVQTRFYREDGSAVNHDPSELIRTQDLEPWFEENSCLYLFTAASFEATGARIGKRPLMFETPRLESIDIDDQEDWTLAAALIADRG